jgi:hypothetical protein
MIPLDTIVARTHMYTYAAKVWDLSIDQGPFSLCRAARFPSHTGLWKQPSRFELSERALVQVEKARNWFNRAITLNPDIGDFWAQYYKFECQHGTKQQQEDLLTKAKSVESRHGEYWYVHSRASR